LDAGDVPDRYANLTCWHTSCGGVLPRRCPGGETASSGRMRSCTPSIDPYDSGHLEVSDGHAVYWEVVGSPSGVPAVWLHGGPRPRPAAGGTLIPPGSGRSSSISGAAAVAATITAISVPVRSVCDKTAPGCSFPVY
jgi:hypothetical protein